MQGKNEIFLAHPEDSAVYPFLPQHFLYLRPLSHGQGSFRPILGSSRKYGVAGGQQVTSSQQLASFPATSSVKDTPEDCSDDLSSDPLVTI